MELRKILPAALLIFVLKIANAGFFGASDFEECANDAAKEAKTNNALLILLRQCHTEFPARRNPNGGYMYFDPLTNQYIQVSSPRLNTSDRSKIQSAENDYKIKESIERQKINSEIEDQRNRNNTALRKVSVESWQIACKSDYSCGEKTITASIKNNSEYSIFQITVGWVVSERIGSCGALADTRTRRIKIESGQTAIVTFDFFDGPSQKPFVACFKVNSVVAK